MTLSTLSFTVLLSFIISTNKIIKQNKDVTYYRQDIGMYFQYDKERKKEKIPFKENWDFYFSIKNDSIAIIQDIRNKIVQEEKEYQISFSVDSAFQKTRKGNKYESKMIYFPTLKLISKGSVK